MSKPDYLKLVEWSDDDQCYVGSIPDLCGKCCHAETQVECYRQLVAIHDDWIETILGDGKPLPPVRTRPMVELV